MKKYLSQLNDMQKKAVEHDSGSLLILAGAGSGKTRVITSKIAYFIEEKGIDPFSILAVTFTNKAAAEMKERAAGLSLKAENSIIRTFHSFGAWFMRRYATFANLGSDFSIYDPSDSVSLLKSIVPGKKKQEYREILNLISKAKNNCLSPSAAESSGFDPEIVKYYKKYQKALIDSNAVDFDDLLLYPVLILREQPEVRARLVSRFKVIMVDEYQDSNYAQFELLKVLYSPENYLCVVGDEDQSIYKFRGAEVGNIISFPKEFEGTEVIMLEQNYRSTGNILEAASSVVSHNTNRMGKSLWTEADNGEQVELHEFGVSDDEVRFCAEIASEGNYGDLAILYRTNAQSLAFESGFKRLGIPFRIVGALSFFERAEVKDVMSWLAFVVNPNDVAAFKRIINKPSRGIGEVTQNKIIAGAFANSLSVAEYLGHYKASGKAKKGIDDFLELFRALEKSLETMSFDKVLYKIVMESGLKDFYEKEDRDTGTSRVDNLEEIINFSADFGQGREAAVGLLESAGLDSQFAANQEEIGDRVTLITMHNTKGLEFPKVVITGLEDGLFPSARSVDVDDLEEERRLMYVAMTRARERLYLTCCRNRRIWGRLQSFRKSIFLKELPENIKTAGDEEPEEDSVFKRGVAVYSDDYGYGVISGVKGSGVNQVLFVDFETRSGCRIMPEYDDIEVVESVW